MEEGRSLTRLQFEEVLRRATELALSGSPEGEEEPRITETELLRISAEVGLSEAHVRQALAEVGSRAPTPEAWADRWFGAESVAAWRVVPGTEEDLLHRLDEFLVGGQLLQPVRRGRNHVTYRPAVDWLSRFAQAAASTSRRYYWASAREVEVRVDRIDPHRSRVELRVDPGVRKEAIQGSVGGSLGGGFGGVGAGVALVMTGVLTPVGAAAVALGIFGGSAALALALSRGHARKKREEVTEELEGVLDRLEMGEGLEPPPASWRRWVQRQAKMLRVDLLGGGDLSGRG